MSFQRIHQSRSQNPQTSWSTSQFAPRPFPVQEPKRPPTQEELENQAFQQNKFEATGLQLKDKYGTITPIEQERMGMLKAKMDSFWAQRMERAKAQPNLLEILIRNSQATQTTESQPPVQSNTIQAKSDITGDRSDSSVEQHPNKTGMPDDLKTGLESLSGYSLDDVRVHYNSPKPAQLQALAYTQSTEIHVAPGEEEHLPHEAWHVVQQAQGRVKPTMQMKGMNVNDDSALEKEADIMGEKSFRTNSGNLEAKNNLGTSGSTVQRTFNPALKLNSFNRLEEEIVTAGYSIIRRVLLMRWFDQESVNESRVLDDLPRIAAAIIASNPDLIAHSVARVEPLAIVEPTPVIAAPTPVFAPPTAKYKLPVKTPAIAAPTPAFAPPTAKYKLPVKAPAIAAPTPAFAPAEEVSASPLIINYVWLGNRDLGPLEKFNIYSWRALGHTVNIYTHPFAGRDVNTASNLGLDPDDANVINLREILDEDDLAEGADNPKAILKDARSLLKSWLGAIPVDGKPSIEHIYNMVDVTKSYIGGTRRGIVLDMKVGPSEHLPKYAKSFSEKFISYSRGGKTMSVENQSMGTMQESEELRSLYAKKFNARIETGIAELMPKPAESWFNLITGYHQGLFIDGRTAKKTLDVATKSPTGEALEPGDYKVSEPIKLGQGPFRVFKAASEQTNSGKVVTTPEHVRILAAEVWKKQLSVLGEDRVEFIEKAKRAKDAI
jgi:Domain of unknown function (DUF4157)